MMLPGAKPKDQKVTRTPVAHDWTEVPDTPYAGERPALPRVGKPTKEWWEAISTMPHCVLWTPANWRYAVDTAVIHHRFMVTRRDAGELRMRMKTLGATPDALRDLRIRYVPVEPAAVTDNPGVVSDFEAERRRRLMESDAD